MTGAKTGAGPVSYAITKPTTGGQCFQTTPSQRHALCQLTY